jgi:hypothetical protein
MELDVTLRHSLHKAVADLTISIIALRDFADYLAKVDNAQSQFQQTTAPSLELHKRKEIQMIFKQIQTILDSLKTDKPVMPPTELFNEGWILRLILDQFKSLRLESESHPLAIPPKCRWYSEALLPSVFLPKSRGDIRAESWTHADGVIGSFDIGNGAKGNLKLHSEAKHFVVLEAKMFTKLSEGVKNAPYFNQAARIVACMAEVLKRAEMQMEEFNALGFYVLAPSSQIKQGLFVEHLSKDSLRKVVEQRVKEYEGMVDGWFKDWFIPLLEQLDIKAISWEDLIGFLTEHDPNAIQLKDFYSHCLEFNKPPERANKRLQ